VAVHCVVQDLSLSVAYHVLLSSKTISSLLGRCFAASLTALWLAGCLASRLGLLVVNYYVGVDVRARDDVRWDHVGSLHLTLRQVLRHLIIAHHLDLSLVDVLHIWIIILLNEHVLVLLGHHHLTTVRLDCVVVVALDLLHGEVGQRLFGGVQSSLLIVLGLGTVVSNILNQAIVFSDLLLIVLRVGHLKAHLVSILLRLGPIVLS